MKPKKVKTADKAEKKANKSGEQKPEKPPKKTEKKVKVKPSKSPRIESQSKSSVLTADRICNRCKVHDMIRSVKGELLINIGINRIIYDSQVTNAPTKCWTVCATNASITWRKLGARMRTERDDKWRRKMVKTSQR